MNDGWKYAGLIAGMVACMLAVLSEVSTVQAAIAVWGVAIFGMWAGLVAGERRNR